MDAEIREFMDRAREAEAWAGIVPDAALRAQWIEIAANYHAMARERLDLLLSPALAPALDTRASPPRH